MKALILFLSIFWAHIALAQELTREDITKEVARIAEKEGAISSVERLTTNGVSVESMVLTPLGADLKKTDDQSTVVVLTNPNGPKVIFSIGKGDNKGSGISIFQKSTHSPYLTVSDENGDGVMDVLTYSVLAENGDLVMEIHDYGMNGSPDLKIVPEGQSEIFYKSQWRKIEQKEGKPSFKMDGKWIETKNALKEIRNEKF